MRAVVKVLVNLKFFFSYAKKHSRVKCNVGPLSKNGTLTNNPSEMAELLQGHKEACSSDHFGVNLKIKLNVSLRKTVKRNFLIMQRRIGEV